MTNLEALKSKVAGYPLSDNTFETALTDRSVVPSETYAGKSKGFELAIADVYIVLLTAVNIAEGGYQLSMTDKSNFMKYASGIYQKWGEPNPLAEQGPQISGVSVW